MQVCTPAAPTSGSTMGTVATAPDAYCGQFACLWPMQPVVRFIGPACVVVRFIVRFIGPACVGSATSRGQAGRQAQRAALGTVCHPPSLPRLPDLCCPFSLPSLHCALHCTCKAALIVARLIAAARRRDRGGGQLSAGGSCIVAQCAASNMTGSPDSQVPAAVWLPLVSIWLPLVSICLPLVSIWLPRVSIWLPLVARSSSSSSSSAQLRCARGLVTKQS